MMRIIKQPGYIVSGIAGNRRRAVAACALH